MNATALARRAIAVLGVSLLAIVLAGCAAAVGTGISASTPPAQTTPTFGGRTTPTAGDIAGKWTLVSGTDGSGPLTTGTATVTFTFNGRDSGGHGPCNSFGATASSSTVGPMTIAIGIHTDIACVDPDVMNSETRYFAILDSVRHASLDSTGRLTLTGDGQLVFTRSTT